MNLILNVSTFILLFRSFTLCIPVFDTRPCYYEFIEQREGLPPLQGCLWLNDIVQEAQNGSIDLAGSLDEGPVRSVDVTTGQALEAHVHVGRHGRRQGDVPRGRDEERWGLDLGLITRLLGLLLPPFDQGQLVLKVQLSEPVPVCRPAHAIARVLVRIKVELLDAHQLRLRQVLDDGEVDALGRCEALGRVGGLDRAGAAPQRVEKVADDGAARLPVGTRGAVHDLLGRELQLVLEAWDDLGQGGQVDEGRHGREEGRADGEGGGDALGVPLGEAPDDLAAPVVAAQHDAALPARAERHDEVLRVEQGQQVVDDGLVAVRLYVLRRVGSAVAEHVRHHDLEALRGQDGDLVAPPQAQVWEAVHQEDGGLGLGACGGPGQHVVVGPAVYLHVLVLDPRVVGRQLGEVG